MRLVATGRGSVRIAITVASVKFQTNLIVLRII